jgi:aminoglycoside 6-adenylyltransferase
VASRVSATGILLVGGASERFGSPKALATFRGETLGERAWRILSETFEEVVAVGKDADALELPFPVLDDGAEERAPVFGLLAGMHAASNAVCCALPVDCPLVTPELLRALTEACAVPQTGPLPGAYPVELVPELEARVARGELSLRGVNPTVLESDAKLLANVNTRMELIEAAIADWAREREDVRGAFVVGSRARADAPADRWSDLDVVLLVDEPGRLEEDASWVEEFGAPVLTFLEPTGIGDKVERRVLYESGEDVDFPMLEAGSWRELLARPEARLVLARGHRMLHDELSVGPELAGVLPPAPSEPPNEEALRELAHDFWYHALWTARKLRRGEVYTALMCLDGYLKERLVTLLEFHAGCVDPSVDTWHSGRFLERWGDPGALAALESAFAHYDVRDVARALWATIDLWQSVEEETARRLGLEIGLDHADLRRRIAEVVPQSARGNTIAP